MEPWPRAMAGERHLGQIIREGTGYVVYTASEDAITSHAAWDESETPRQHFGISELIAEALGYPVGAFYNAMEYHAWLHSGPPDDELPDDHWIRRYREYARHTRCPRFRYRIIVEAEEIEEE